MQNVIERPQLTVVNGHATTTSLQVAEHFGKLHKNVMLAIQNLECSQEFSRLNFKPTSFEVNQPNGGTRKSPAYTITRDGFVFLAMGFTGKDAAKWKEAYIAAFNAMESELSNPAKKPAALPAPGQLGRDSLSAINKRAWQLSHEAYEDYRARMQRDRLVLCGHTQPQDWAPIETTQDVLEILEVAAGMCDAHANSLRNRGRRLAELVGRDFDQAVAKYLSPEDKAKRIK